MTFCPHSLLQPITVDRIHIAICNGQGSPKIFLFIFVKIKDGMKLLGFLGSQFARYLIIPPLTLFLGWLLRSLAFGIRRSHFEDNSSKRPLLGINLSVSSFMLVLIDVSIYLSNNTIIPTTYGVKILFSIMSSLIIMFGIVFILRSDSIYLSESKKYIATVLGIASIVISYFIMKI